MSGILFALQVTLIFAGNGAYGGADNIGHYRIARYAFQYPELFFDHWGKPVFTLLFAPFATLGFRATQVLNAFIGSVTLIFAADLLRLTGIRNRWAVIVLSAFAPMYFMLMHSCLTEILMSFFVVLAIWLVFKEKVNAAAVLLSFIPFVRTESIVIIPLFIVFFIIQKRYLAIFLLLAGSAVYSVAGYFVYHDFLWIIRQIPYSMGDSLYGSGELLHFVKSHGEITGKPFSILLAIGIFAWMWKLIPGFRVNDKKVWFFLLVNGVWMAYFAAHSYVWWQGTGGSLGLIRVIAAVIPLMAIPAVEGLNFVLEKIWNKYFRYALIVAMVAWQISVPVRQHRLPFRWERPQEMMAGASSWLSGVESGRIFYFDPFLLHFLNMNPYEQNLNNWGVGDKLHPSNSMEVGDILVWDAHFGPNEGGVQLSILMEDPMLQLEKTFLPHENFKVLGGYDYGIYIFRKVSNKSVTEPLELVERRLEFSNHNGDAVVEKDGKKLLQMGRPDEFSPAIQVPLNEIKSGNYIELRASVRYLPGEDLGYDAVLLILSAEHGGKTISYNKSDMETRASGQDFKDVTLEIRVAPEFPEGSVLNLYVWNKDRKKLWIERLEISARGY